MAQQIETVLSEVDEDKRMKAVFDLMKSNMQKIFEQNAKKPEIQ